MKCNKCGTVLNNNDQFCSNCGEKREVVNATTTDLQMKNNDVVNKANYVSQNQQKNGSNGVVIVIIFIIIATLIGGGIFLFAKWNDKDKNSEGDSNSNSTNKQSVVGYWITSDKEMIFAFEKTEMDGASDNPSVSVTVSNDDSYGFSLLGKGKISFASSCETKNSEIKCDDKVTPYQFQGNKLVLTIDSESYAFDRVTEEQFEKVSETVTNQIGNMSFDDNDDFSDDNDTISDYYDKRIIGNWSGSNGTNIKFTYDDGLYAQYGTTFASATMDTMKIEIYRGSIYQYSFSGDKLILIDTKTNTKETFTKR